jgi:hypothetical protein
VECSGNTKLTFSGPMEPALLNIAEFPESEDGTTHFASTFPVGMVGGGFQSC